MLFSIDNESISAEDKHRCWYAIYTRHQHEKTVGDMLQRKGFEVFLPLYRTKRRWRDRVKTLALPLFPSYVFLHGGIDRQLQIVTTPGVHWMITAAGQVAVIPDAEIAAVKRLVEGPLRVEPHPFLKCGDWVRVKNGPLEGIEGIMVRVKSACRLVISVEMLQKSVAVEVNASDVERARRAVRASIPTVLWSGIAPPALRPDLAVGGRSAVPASPFVTRD